MSSVEDHRNEHILNSKSEEERNFQGQDKTKRLSLEFQTN